MTTLSRKTQKIFAGSADADQIAVFGSMKTGTPDYDTDVEQLQSTAYTEGWSEAILSDKAPYLEEMNGVQYGFSYQIAYVLQEGIPEYDANTNYSDTSIVKSVDSSNNIILFHSLSDNNLGNALTDTTKWQRLYITTVGYIGQPQITLNFGADEDILPIDCMWLDGAQKQISQYPLLYNVYREAYNDGTEDAGYFRIPDLRDRVFWGADPHRGDTAGYISAGLPNITGYVGHVDNGANASGAFYWSGKGGKLENKTGEPDPNVYFNANSGAVVAGIYRDDVTTVQPPAIKCRVFTRYQQGDIMRIYNYSRNTGEYIGESEAPIDREASKAEGKNVYYTPACSTFTKPPKTSKSEVAIYIDGWQVCADFRGCWIVNADMQPQKMDQIGDLPEGFISITDAQYAKIIESPDFYIIEEGELIPNPNYTQIKYQENINSLTQELYLLKSAKAYGGVVVDNAYVFETNQVSITNTVASLALMTSKINWKFYNLEGFPVAIDLTKTQLSTIAKFGQKMINDCFVIEGAANEAVAQAAIEDVNNAQWRNDFLASVREQMNAVNNNIEIGL